MGINPDDHEQLFLSTPTGPAALQEEMGRLIEDRVEFALREPCCDQMRGYLAPRGSQNVVRCWVCNRARFNAPKIETGAKPMSVSTVHSLLKPKQRFAILERQGGACWICNATNRTLHLGHLLSVYDGLAQGLTHSEINHPANLVALCEECNLGQGERSITLRAYHRLMSQLLRAEIGRQQGA